MSQYGANYYANQGKNYREILGIYFKNVELIDTSSEYEPLDDYEKYFR
jgi:peptidoglycan hydrolase-like amidase